VPLKQHLRFQPNVLSKHQNMGVVTLLLIKPESKKPLSLVDHFIFNENGIVGNITCLPLRQVLIVPTCTTEEFKLKPGDLMENILVEYDALYSLPSGTVVKIGDAHIRLTFHCEPCGRIKDKVNLKSITHKRGYLGQFLNSGGIKIGDRLEVTKQRLEPIPYDVKERIVWFLKKQEQPVPVSVLLREVGLSLGYARAVPALFKGIPNEYHNLVFFKGRKNNPRNLRFDM